MISGPRTLFPALHLCLLASPFAACTMMLLTRMPGHYGNQIAFDPGSLFQQTMSSGSLPEHHHSTAHFLLYCLWISAAVKQCLLFLVLGTIAMHHNALSSASDEPAISLSRVSHLLHKCPYTVYSAVPETV